MAQATAAGLTHGAVAANPASGSQKIRVDKLSPARGFEAKVLGPTEKKKGRRGVTAVRSELQVIPVCYLRIKFPSLWMLLLWGRVCYFDMIYALGHWCDLLTIYDHYSYD